MLISQMLCRYIVKDNTFSFIFLSKYVSVYIDNRRHNGQINKGCHSGLAFSFLILFGRSINVCASVMILSYAHVTCPLCPLCKTNVLSLSDFLTRQQ